MWTRVPPSLITSDHSIVPSCLLALDDQEAEAEAEAFSLRLHHNHQPGEQEHRLEYTSTKYVTLALDHYVYPSSSPSSHQSTTHIHHDLRPEAAGFFKRFVTSTEGFIREQFSSKHWLPHMSTPEGARRGRNQQQVQLTVSDTCERTQQLVGGVSGTDHRRQLDDMQTQFGNAKHTRLNAASSDQEVPELVERVSKKRRVVASLYNETFTPPKDDQSPHSLDQACEEHSGVTHMADLDSSSKASTPEDIDSTQVLASRDVATAKPCQIAATPQCSSTPPRGSKRQAEIVTEQESSRNKNHHVEFQSQSRQSDPQPSDDDTQSTSQIRRFWVPHSLESRYASKSTMAGHGSEEWLKLSLGSGAQSSDDQTQADQDHQPADDHSPTRTITPPTSTDPAQGSIRDFFKFGSETSELVHHGSTYTSSPVTPRHRQQYSGTPESTSHRSSGGAGATARPLTFLEPRPRSSRDYSPWADPSVNLPRVPSGGNVGSFAEGQFMSPSQVVQQQRLPAFSNLATLPYHPARVLHPVRGEQTETTSIHASPWAGMGVGVQQHPHHEAPRTPPNPAELFSMATPGAFRDWRSVPPSVQPPLAQGVDPEQAWRNLLQRVESNYSVPTGFGGAGAASSSSGRGDAMMLPPGEREREEYLDALARAVEKFQGPDQGGRDELQRLQRNPMYPPGQRLHLGPFDPSTEISLAGFLGSSSGSKSRAPAPASSSDRQRRLLRPRPTRPGLWFTLQVENAQPEASPLQQIPTAYIRVVDGSMTVAAVRRYLVNKLELATEDEVELTCRGQPLQPSMPLTQVRDAIWQSPNTNTPNSSTPHLMSEGKAWKSGRDGSITLVGDVVMVLTYGRRPEAPRPASA